MSDRQAVSVEVSNILSLVGVAWDYGHANDVFFDAMAGFLDYSCSDSEIEAHCSEFLTPEMRQKGYGEEDYEGVMQIITAWRDKYCTKEPEASHRTTKSPTPD